MSRVCKICGDETRAAKNKPCDDRPGKKVEAEHRESKSHAADAKAGEHHSDDIEAFVLLGTHIRYVARGKEYSEQANWNIDDEDPMPRRVGRDETTDWRPHHRAGAG